METNGKLYLTSNSADLFDTSYRYQIKLLDYSQVTKKGTRITIINNLNKFSSDILFDSNTLLKIIGKHLSCKIGILKDEQLPYLQGCFAPSLINQVVYRFIQEYLLCQNCDKPEINISLKTKKIYFKCRACGHKLCRLCDDSIELLILSKEINKNVIN